MQMICETADEYCAKYCIDCSHSKPHTYNDGCDTHKICVPQSCSLFVSKKPLPLTNIPGVSFDKEECYLVPVKHLGRQIPCDECAAEIVICRRYYENY